MTMGAFFDFVSEGSDLPEAAQPLTFRHYGANELPWEVYVDLVRRSSPRFGAGRPDVVPLVPYRPCRA